MNNLQVLEYLKINGHRLTLVRKNIIEIFTDGHQVYTAPELLEKLSERGLPVNKATVYRELDFLVENGVLKQLLFNGGIVHYEIALGNNHHHLVCMKCGLIQDVVVEKDLQKLENKLMEDTTFQITGHQLEFYGLCNNCLKQKG